MKNRIAFALLLAASACWVPVDKGRQMDARIQRLETESAATTQQIEEQRTVVRDRIARVDQKIVEVQKKLDELNTTAHRSGADVVANQDRMQESLTRMVGQLEEQQHQLQQTDQRLSQLQSDTEARFAALKGAGALEDYEGRKRAETLKRPTDKSEFYALAMQQEQAGERAVARQLYDEYVKKWPTDPRAADAWFRMGEISFGEKRYREAVLSYGKVAQDFPRSDKAPDALFRTGEAMLALDLRDDAKAIFQDVVKRYPKTTAAKKAGARLAEMSKNVQEEGAPEAVARTRYLPVGAGMRKCEVSGRLSGASPKGGAAQHEARSNRTDPRRGRLHRRAPAARGPRLAAAARRPPRGRPRAPRHGRRGRGGRGARRPARDPGDRPRRPPDRPRRPPPRSRQSVIQARRVLPVELLIETRRGPLRRRHERPARHAGARRGGLRVGQAGSPRAGVEGPDRRRHRPAPGARPPRRARPAARAARGDGAGAADAGAALLELVVVSGSGGAPLSRPSSCSFHWAMRFITVLLAIWSSFTTAARLPRLRRRERRMASRSISSRVRPGR